MKKLKQIFIIIFIYWLTTSLYLANTTLTSNDATSQVLDSNASLFGYSVTYLGKITSSLGNFYAISAPFDGSSGNFDSGKLYLFEQSLFSSTPISTSNATLTLQGSSKDEEIGLFIAAGGDLDKDGLNDFVLINPNLTSNQIKIYLGKYYNNWTSSTIVTLSDPNISIEQTSNRYLSSNVVSISGDLNGDGYDDLVIGLTRNTDDTNASGKVAIIYGSRDIESINNSLQTAANNIVTGQTANEGFGYSVSIVNDINQDGYDELLVGAFNESTETGKLVALKYGAFTSLFPLSEGAATEYDYSNMDAIIFSESNGIDGFGQFVQGIGDYNNDGYGDFAVSAPKSGVNNGKVYIYNGSNTALSGAYSETNPASTTFSLSNSYFLGLQGVFGKYDVTGDGIQDLIITQALANTDSGSVYILDSSKTYSGEIDISTSIDYQINNIQASGEFGHSVGIGSDLNNDGIHDIVIGTNGYDNNNGSAFFYQLASTSLANPLTLQLFSDENYSVDATSAEINQRLYIQVSGNDPNSAEINMISLTIESGSSNEGIIIYAIETAVDSGIYRTDFMITGTRNDSILKQIFCSKSDTVTVFSSTTPAVQDSLVIVNSVPIVSNISIEQIDSGLNTKVQVYYTLVDLNNDSVTFATASSVQFSTDNGLTWENATLDATTSVVEAKNQEQTFDSTNTPLILTNFSNYDGDLKVRIRGSDGASFSSYVESEIISVDNQAPDAATIYTINPKYSETIIVTGNAEALSTILIYNEGNLVSSTQTPSSGEFEITNLPVSVTQNSITVFVQDSFNFLSPVSNQLDITFADRSINFNENNYSVTASIALGATTNEQLLSLDSIVESSLPQNTPTLYNFVNSFSLLVSEKEYVSFDIPTTFNVTFSSEIASKNGLTVFLYNPNSLSWESNKATLLSSSTSSLSFSSNYLGKFLIAQLNDIKNPTISDVKINNYAIKDNQYYGSSFNLTATFSDSDSTIASYNVSIISDTTNTPVSTFSDIYGPNNAQNEVSISVNPNNLTTDTYTIQITVEDEYTNQTRLSYYINVNMSQLNFDILAGPNPVNFNTSPLIFGYNLSQDIDTLGIYILDQRGETVFQDELQNVLAGYSTYSYNGINKYSKKLSNGIYYAYCFAKKGNNVIKKRLKIAVLK